MTVTTMTAILPILVFVVLPVLLWVLYMGAQAFRHWYEPIQYKRSLIRSTANSHQGSRGDSGSYIADRSPISTISGGHNPAKKNEIFVAMPINPDYRKPVYGNDVFVFDEEAADLEHGSSHQGTGRNWVLTPRGSQDLDLDSPQKHVCRF